MSRFIPQPGADAFYVVDTLKDALVGSNDGPIRFSNILTADTFANALNREAGAKPAGEDVTIRFRNGRWSTKEAGV